MIQDTEFQSINNLRKEVDYKEIDRKSILSYLESFPDRISVESIIFESGAERLRVYPILFELEQEGILLVVERDFFGAPVSVKLVSSYDVWGFH